MTASVVAVVPGCVRTGFGIISAGATNLLDEEFQFFDIDERTPSILPTRRMYAKITLSF